MKCIRWYETRTEIATFALPLLKEFRRNYCGYPRKLYDDADGDTAVASAQWANILGDMEDAMKILVDDHVLDEHQEKELQRKLELFGKWFYHLWD